MSHATVSDQPTTVPGLLPRVSRHPAPAFGAVAAAQLGAGGPTGTVLNFRDTAGWGNVSASWTAGVSTAAATFEAWIRTSVAEEQTILLGSNNPGATPRISVGNDQISVYWDTTGSGAGWTSADTTPVTDGQWHHVAVVFDGGAMTFYKDGVATADTLQVSGARSAAGSLQLGAGFGSAQGFVGQIWNPRVWSVARAAGDVQATRWATLGSGTDGLVASVDFDGSDQRTVDRVSGAEGSIDGCNVTTTDLPTPTVVLSVPGAGTFMIPELSAGAIACTMECWIRMSTAGGVAERQATILNMGEYLIAEPSLFYAGGDALGFMWQDETYTSTDVRPISDGAWHHVAMVLNQGLVTFYKDGIACGDTYQMAVAHPAEESGLLIGGAVDAGVRQAFDGQLYDVRLWSTAQTAAQISAFRYARLSGSEPGLVALVNMAGADPSTPAGMTPINQVTGVQVEMQSPASTVVAELPQQPLPQQVWTYPTPGVSPVGPTLSASGVLCTDGGSTEAPGAFLRCVELQTGQAVWSYDAQTTSGYTTAVIPSAVTVAGTTAYVGVQNSQPDNVFLELHYVDLADGTLIGPTPVSFSATGFLTRPVIAGGTAYVGVDLGGGSSGIASGSPGSDASIAFVNTVGGDADFMSDPVIVGNALYVAVAQNGQTTVLMFQLDEPGSRSLWTGSLPAGVTGGICLGDGLLYVPTGGNLVAVNTADGTTAWSHELSGSPVHAAPVLVGSTLCVGSTDGVVYALDSATGDELWRVDTGSPIATDLEVEDSVLYFANQGDGTDTAPAFMAIDVVSLGNDVLSFTVPEADTILFVQGGVTSGLVYFYGAQAVYAVNMANVIREFGVTSKLIVEQYDIPSDPSQDPTGSDTSYRVTLTVRDEDGVARVGQAIKVWSAGTVYVVNQGDPLTLTADAPVWFLSDNDGDLTLAVSAFDDGTPTGNPNLACPPLYVWSSFMGPDEAIVIYPDHEQLTTLANVEGSTPSDVAAAAPGTLYLDTATGYDGSALILSDYSDPTSLTNIAATVRNTIGTRNPTSVGATALSGHVSNRHVRATDVFPNAVFSRLGDGAPTRPYVAGADPTFTMDLSSGLPLYTTAYDPTRPSNLPPVSDDASLGSIFHDIEHFVSNVVKGVEMVAKMAWQAVDNVVTTVIHTAESIYNLTISTLEDAVSAVAGFFKSVVADVRKVIQWLSALFDWGNILKNHAIIKGALVKDPSDPTAPPGVIDQLTSWVSGELSGSTTDTSSTISSLLGQGSSSLSDSSSGMGGSTVGQQSANGGNDPTTAYNSGGQNNAGQCTYLHQKMKENAAGASVSALLARSSATGGVWDGDSIVQSWDNFKNAVDSLVSSSFGGLPSQMHAALMSTADSFKDPKSLVSTGFADMLTAFEVVADDMISFAEGIAKDFLQLVSDLVGQLVSFLQEPIDIPFISPLWKAITHGDDLTLLDLLCLVAAVPATILLAVFTGSPVVPEDDAVGSVDPVLAKQVLLAIAGFEGAVAAAIVDCISLSLTMTAGDTPANTYWGRCDLVSDFVSWAFGMVVSQGWAAWEAKDWVFWSVQTLPILGNFVSIFYTPSWSYDGADQILRDTLWGIIFIVVAGVYASKWHSSYRDAKDAPGLVISANTLSSMAYIDELLFFVAPGDSPEGTLVMIAKMLFAQVANVLGFTANVVNAVRG